MIEGLKHIKPRTAIANNPAVRETALFTPERYRRDSPSRNSGHSRIWAGLQRGQGDVYDGPVNEHHARAENGCGQRPPPLGLAAFGGREVARRDDGFIAGRFEEIHLSSSLTPWVIVE